MRELSNDKHNFLGATPSATAISGDRIVVARQRDSLGAVPQFPASLQFLSLHREVFDPLPGLPLCQFRPQ